MCAAKAGVPLPAAHCLTILWRSENKFGCPDWRVINDKMKRLQGSGVSTPSSGARLKRNIPCPRQRREDGQDAPGPADARVGGGHRSRRE